MTMTCNIKLGVEDPINMLCLITGSEHALFRINRFRMHVVFPIRYCCNRFVMLKVTIGVFPSVRFIKI